MNPSRPSFFNVPPNSITTNLPPTSPQNFSCAKKIFFALATITAIGGIVALVIGNLGILPSPYAFVAIVGGTASFAIGCGIIVTLMLKNRTGGQYIQNPGSQDNQGRNSTPPSTTDPNSPYSRLGRNNAPSNQNNPTPQGAPSPQVLPRQNDVDLNGQIPPPSQENDEDDVQAVPEETIRAQSYNGLRLRVNRQHMRQNPQYHLDKFYDLIRDGNLDGRIHVKFIKNNGREEEGMDAGGLRMAYINNLFSNVLGKLLHCSISASSGLFYPTVNQPKDKVNLEKLGYIMGYCRRQNYPIGAHFDVSLFSALLFGFKADDLNKPYNQLNDESKERALHPFFFSRTMPTVSQQGFEYEEARLWEIAGKSSEQIEVSDLKFIFKYALKNCVEATEHKDPEGMSQGEKTAAAERRKLFQAKFREFSISQHKDILGDNPNGSELLYLLQGVAVKDELLLTDEQFINNLIRSRVVKIEDESQKTYRVLQGNQPGNILTEEELLNRYRILSEEQYTTLLIEFRDVIKDFKDDVCQHTFDPYAAALHALAQGFKSTLGSHGSNGDQQWESLQAGYGGNDQEAGINAFQRDIQGTIDKEFIAANIRCSDDNHKVREKTQWLRNWILRKASVKQIKEFLVFATGNSSLSRPIMIITQMPRRNNQTADEHGYTPFPVSHTCSSQLEIAPGVAGSLESFNDETEESFCQCIETAIRGACEDGGEFNDS